MKTCFTCSIIGHFSFGKEIFNGQTIKTHNMYCALKDNLGESNVCAYDTSGGIKALFKLPFLIVSALRCSKNIVILPAQRGIKTVLPLLLFFNLFYKRRLHYVVIGGWLPFFCSKKKSILRRVSKLDYVYVETNYMRTRLEEQGMKNIVVMPNFKNIVPITFDQLTLERNEPYHICTFSRVMKEKGIEDIVDVVRDINLSFGRVAFELDIYGEVDNEQKKWFESLVKVFPPYINYCGCVDPSKSVDVIKKYFVLVFPTYYSGEGFAGTILDALASGVPIIASDWKYNKEIINDDVGFLFEPKNKDDLKKTLLYSIQSVDLSKKEKCLKKSLEFLPNNVIQIMIHKMI